MLIKGKTIGINISPMIQKYGENGQRVLENYEKLIEFILSETDCTIALIPHTKAPLSMAYKLYDSCRSEKEIYIVNGADHAENYQADPEKYGDIIIRFIKKHMSYSQKED